MTRRIEFQKTKLYNAEREVREALGYSDLVMSWPDVKRFVRKATNSRWWKTNSPILYVRLGDGRGRRGGAAFPWFSHGTGKILLPKLARNPWTICHELAHLLTEPQWVTHGSVFCRNLLELVKRRVGKEEHDKAVEIFKRRRIHYRGSLR